jgi:hypothetical protein
MGHQTQALSGLASKKEGGGGKKLLANHPESYLP